MPILPGELGLTEALLWDQLVKMVDQFRVKQEGIKNGSGEQIQVLQGLKGRHPDAPAESIHPLTYHDEPKHVNDLKLNPKLKLQLSDFVDQQLVEAGTRTRA